MSTQWCRFASACQSQRSAVTCQELELAVCAGGWKDGVASMRGTGATAECEVAVQEAVAVGTGGAGNSAVEALRSSAG